jgi:hypothetical protein
LGTFIDTVRLFATAAGIALEVELTGDAPESIAAALDRVRFEAQPCAFAIPDGTSVADQADLEHRAPDGELVRHELGVHLDCARDPAGFVLLPDAHAYPIVGCPNACADFALPGELVLRRPCAAGETAQGL